jgi:uncharacterized membrane protein YqjE
MPPGESRRPRTLFRAAMPDPADRGDGIMRLVHRTADGVAELVAQHLKLARLELTRDLVTAARRARVIAVMALLAIVGYALTMAGVAAFLGDRHRLGVAFLSVGLAHLGVGAIGILLAVTRRAPAPLLMNATTDEVKRSLASLSATGMSAALEKTRAG